MAAMGHGTVINNVIWRFYMACPNTMVAGRCPPNMSTDNSTYIYRAGACQANGVKWNVLMNTILIIHTKIEQSIKCSLKQRYQIANLRNTAPVLFGWLTGGM